MMTRKTYIAGPLIAAMLIAAPAASQDQEPTKGELKLAKMLEGREAGEPTSCIRNFPTPDLTVIDGTALVYKQGRILYVNIPKDPASIDDDDTLVTRLNGTQLCRTDIMTTVDRFNGFYTGNIFLSDFVPYREKDPAT